MALESVTLPDSPTGTRARAMAWAAVALAAAAAALMVVRALDAGYSKDFSYILVAGRMWITGADPYGPGFAGAGAKILPPDATTFVYPPNWWLIAVGLACLEGSRAFLVWKFVNLV